MMGGPTSANCLENPEKNARGPLDFKILRAQSRDEPLSSCARTFFTGTEHAAPKKAETALAPKQKITILLHINQGMRHCGSWSFINKQSLS